MKIQATVACGEGKADDGDWGLRIGGGENF